MMLDRKPSIRQNNEHSTSYARGLGNKGAPLFTSTNVLKDGV